MRKYWVVQRCQSRKPQHVDHDLEQLSRQQLIAEAKQVHPAFAKLTSRIDDTKIQID